MTHYPVTEADGAWVLPVEGWRIDRCCAEVGGISVELLDKDGERSRMDFSRFRFRSPGGEEQLIDAGRDYREAHPVFERLGQDVAQVLACKDGELRIVFGDGAEIAVPRMDGVEAWEVSGPGNVFVVAPTDDSEPAVWD